MLIEELVLERWQWRSSGRGSSGILYTHQTRHFPDATSCLAHFTRTARFLAVPSVPDDV